MVPLKHALNRLVGLMTGAQMARSGDAVTGGSTSLLRRDHAPAAQAAAKSAHHLRIRLRIPPEALELLAGDAVLVAIQLSFVPIDTGDWIQRR